MVEEEKKEEEQKDEGAPADDTDKGSEPQTITLIDKANKAAERMEAANNKTEELLTRQEKLEAERVLGGKAEAGIEAKKPAELTDEEYAEKVYAGEINPLEDVGSKD